MATERLQRAPADEREYHARHLRILDKRRRLVPLRWNRAQSHFHEHRTGRDLVLKARQLGFSTYIQGEMYRRTVSETRTTITLAHDSETTQKLRRMANRFWENHTQQPERKYANASLTTYPEHDSEATIATAGNLDVGRGGTYSDFHGSEVAFWPDAERIVSGAMQGGNPDVTLESTPNGAQGYFYDLCMEAMNGGGVWKLHFYPWWWDDEYRLALAEDEVVEYTPEERALVGKHGLDAGQIKWRREKRKELRDLFAQEYPEDPVTCFLTSGRSYFGNLDGVFSAPVATNPQQGHSYQAGLDFGQSVDYTVMIVLDMTARRMVDYLHLNQMEWGEMRRRIAAMAQRWGANVIAEANSIGSVNIEELTKLGVSVTPWTTTNQSKAEAMSDLHSAIHDQGLRLMDWAVLKYQMMNFVSTQTPSGLWRLAADGDGHDDAVIALALANQPANWYFA